MNIYLNWLCFFSSLALAILHSTRCLTIIQQKNYKLEKNNRRIKAERILFFLCCMLSAIILTTMSFFKFWLPTSALMLIIVLFLAGWVSKLNKNTKVPLKYTNRMIRLIILYLVVLISVLSLFLFLLQSVYMVFAAFMLLAFNAILLDIINKIASIFENLNNQRYISRAALKLAAPSIYKIGITGSWGKTSVKNILTELLACNYKVLATPANYNTPLGISRTLQDENLNNYQIFIAEMGARYKGDIKKLAKMVRPNAAIITGIGPQHLATFKSVKNIVKEKSELAQAVGYCVFDADNLYSHETYNKITCQKIAVSISGGSKAQVYAKNISFYNNTTYFDIEFEDGTHILRCATNLLGTHNLTNILQAVSMAKYLGVENATIKQVIAGLTPVPHRLQIVPNTRGITIIDDTYNANLEGVKSAYRVLQRYTARKVVFTQGIAELGKQSVKINRQIGEMLAQAADIVMLTGSNSAYIEQGLMQAGFDKSKIYNYASLDKAKEDFGKVLIQGDVLLLQNDLIDIS